MLKGQVLRPSEAGETHPLLEQHPALATGAKIFVLGTTEQDLAKVQSIDQHINTRKTYRPPPAVKVKRKPGSMYFLLFVLASIRYADD